MGVLRHHPSLLDNFVPELAEREAPPPYGARKRSGAEADGVYQACQMSK